MEGDNSIARESWADAQQKWTEVRQLIKARAKEDHVDYNSLFNAAEDQVKSIRLACMNIMFHNFSYALDKKVEPFLWTVHTFLNNEYRKWIRRVGAAHKKDVQKRKLEKMYADYLREASYFYRGYVQRLVGRFRIPELMQAGEVLEIAAEDLTPAVDAVPSALRAIIIDSCYNTLVHLGDLSRYHCQARPGKPSKTSYRNAQAYYSLANGLLPENGLVHNQLAVLHQIEEDHLEIAYRFYRAISIGNPYELSLTNLEKEFKDPSSVAAPRRPGFKDPSLTLITWFLRLHAYFFHGDHFSQHKEMETEVLLRIESLLKSKQHEEVLLKMFLLNMAAYDVATEKVKSNWTMKGSQSCQFLLALNVKAMNLVTKLLIEELESRATVLLTEKQSNLNTPGVEKFSFELLKLLPLFRIYVAWIYVRRSDFIQYQEYLEPHIRDMYRTISACLTLLNECVEEFAAYPDSKYLLKEDTEALGLKALDSRQIPLFIKWDVSDPTRTKPRKYRKPTAAGFGNTYDDQTESVWRIRDAVCCGVLLSCSPKFPIAMADGPHDDRETEVWVYVDDFNMEIRLSEERLQRLVTKLKVEVEPVVSKLDEEVSFPLKGEAARRASSRVGSSQNASYEKSASVSAANNDKSKSIPPSNLTLNTTKDYQDSDIMDDSKMVDMVNDLLDPSEEDHTTSNHARKDSSYGMNSSTANDIFGGLQVSPRSENSPANKAIPTLPWNYFWSPGAPADTNVNPSGGLSLDKPRNMDTRLGELASDDMTTAHALRTNVQEDSGAIDAMAALESRIRALDTQRKNTLPGRSTTLGSLQTDGRDATRVGPRSFSGQFSSGISSFGPQPANVNNTRLPTRQQRPMDIVTGLSSLHYHQETDQPYGRTIATGSSASGAQQISPWSNQKTPVGYDQQQASPWSAQIAPNNRPLNQASPYQQPHSSNFSNPSSFDYGTPVACNGNWYNASTAWGRGTVNNRDDPTHYRNRVKDVVGDDGAASYDAAIFAAALADDKSSRQS